MYKYPLNFNKPGKVNKLNVLETVKKSYMKVIENKFQSININMAKPILSGKKRFKQGIFLPKNPHKYVGNPSNIVYRSSWEKVFLIWCDQNPIVLRYASEEIVIQYVSPLDGKVHRYFVDFYIVVKQRDGSSKKYLIEIKPYSQTIPPKNPKVISESYKESVQTYMINQAKWDAARSFCKRQGMEFYIMTERQLFNTKSSRSKK